MIRALALTFLAVSLTTAPALATPKKPGAGVTKASAAAKAGAVAKSATTPARPKLDFRLVEAAYLGDLPRLDALLAQGAETEVLDAHGYTPLLWAAQQGHEAVVDALLAQGANVEARSRAGHSALLIAVAQRHSGIVRSLLREGADPLVRGAGRLSPYGYAKAHAQAEMVKLMDRAMAGERL